MSSVFKNTGGSGNGTDLNVSFEFFPPKTPEMEQVLWSSIQRLEPLNPQFVSVTYGAGGSTRERTHATVARVLQETSLTPAAHLTCVGANCDDIDEVIRSYHEVGVRHVVALRGDAPEGPGTRYAPHPGGYENSAALVSGLKRIGGFEISVAAYPEKHPDSPSVETDLDMLQAKVEAGADRAITQFFFDNDLYFRYLDRVRARGIEIPVRPGIVPIHNYRQVSSFAKRCGTHMPSRISKRFEGIEDDPETQKLVGATLAAEQVMELAAQGVTDFHFYTLNRADLVYAICHMLGMRPRKAAQQEAAQ